MKRDDLIPGFLRRIDRRIGAAALALMLAGCQADELGYGPKHLREVSRETQARMVELGMDETSPVLMRIFKEENTFEVWKKDRTGRYQLLKSYEICKWSGNIGPKIKEGDRQAPEGYYTITPALMNPNSQYYLAFNTGFPNAYDRAHGRTGSALMVHGACSSRGCYAMTDEQIQEIYALARDAFRGGQRAFQLQAYPFRMTAENMARHWKNPNMPFWKMMKEGYDTFELTRMEPKVDVCGRKYVFNAGTRLALSPIAPCPDLEQPVELRMALAKKAAEDEQKAIVIAARLESEQKARDDQQIMIAQKKEEIRLAALEKQKRAAEGGSTNVLATLFGDTSAAEAVTATAPAERAATASPALAGTVPAGSTDPLPRPAPREPQTALALAAEAPSQAADSRSMFGRLFSFGDEDRPIATAIAPVEPAAADVGPQTTASITEARPPLARTAAPEAAAPAAGKTDLPAPPAAAVVASTEPPAPAAAAPQPSFWAIRNWF